MEKELTTYQIYLILMGSLAEQDDAEMLKPMLTELYRRAESAEIEEGGFPLVKDSMKLLVGI